MSNPTGKGGFQERKHQINRKGRPKDFAGLRSLGKQIAHEALTLPDGARRTVAEAILRKLVTENPERFLEIAFGKIPVPIELTANTSSVIHLAWGENDDDTPAAETPPGAA